MEFGDYIVYVDESGDHGLKSVDADFPVFTLAFTIINKKEYRDCVIPAVTTFKNKYFGHDQVILHENDIRKERGAFAFLRINKELRERFYNDLNNIISECNFHYIASVIKKTELIGKYAQNAHNPYEISMLFCMERLLDYLKKKSQHGKSTHIIIEERGKKEDNDLELEFRRICDNERKWGYKKNTDFKQIPFSLVHANKRSNSSGLQLADLIARPISLKILRPDQPNRAYDIIQSKGIIKCFP